MRILILFALLATAGFGQAVECSGRAACEAAVRANPKNSFAHFRLGEIYFELGNHQDAALRFRDAIDGDRNPKWTLVWSYVNLGKIFDAGGSRNRAVNEYRKAQQTGDNTRGALDEAAKYLAVPFRRN